MISGALCSHFPPGHGSTGCMRLCTLSPHTRVPRCQQHTGTTGFLHGHSWAMGILTQPSPVMGDCRSPVPAASWEQHVWELIWG